MPLTPQKLLVFLDHAQVGEFPSNFRAELEGGVLHILNERGVSVKEYGGDQWHAVGTGITCGYIDTKDDCSNCRKS